MTRPLISRVRSVAVLAFATATLCIGGCTDAPVNAPPVQPSTIAPAGGAIGNRGQATPAISNPPADAAMRR